MRKLVAHGKCMRENCPSDTHDVYLVKHDGYVITNVYVCRVCGFIEARILGTGQGEVV